LEQQNQVLLLFTITSSNILKFICQLLGIRKSQIFFTLEGESKEKIGPYGKFVMKNAITDLETYQALFDGVTDEIAMGEASTSYLYSEKAPQRIYHYIPDVKLIAILRDPVERAFSHFLFSLSNGREPIRNFAKTIAREEKRIADNWSFQWHHKRRGFYYLQLKRYFELFDSRQIKVYLYEDLKKDPLGLTQNIFRFLEVDDNFSPNVKKKHNPTKVPKNETLNSLLNRPNLLKTGFNILVPQAIRQPIANYLKQKNLGKPKLSKKIRRQLIEDYREDILKLQDLIERNLSSWLEV
jgi:hypothetical protein